MNNGEIIKELVTVDVQLELIINRFESLGLLVEPNKENPNAIATLIYEAQSSLGNIIFNLSDYKTNDEVIRKEYYDSIGGISSAEDISEFVTNTVEILNNGGKEK